MSMRMFDTETEALHVALTMAGWDVEVVEWTTLEGHEGWVIQAQAPGATGQPTFLRDDGMVR